MIREFFVPRVFFIFATLWTIMAFILALWSYATRRSKKRFITAARIPVISGTISLLLTIVLMVFVEVLN